MELKIKNKAESVNMIEKLNLNTFSQKLVNVKNGEGVIDFLDNNPSELYFLRDCIGINAKMRHSVPREEVIDAYEEFELCAVGISPSNYIEHMLLIGNIIVYSDGRVVFEGTDDRKYISVREAANNAKYHISTHIFDKKLKCIRGMNEILDYIWKYNLEDMIVEFSAYDIEVGINNERVVIMELRTDY